MQPAVLQRRDMITKHRCNRRPHHPCTRLEGQLWLSQSQDLHGRSCAPGMDGEQCRVRSHRGVIVPLHALGFGLRVVAKRSERGGSAKQPQPAGSGITSSWLLCRLLPDRIVCYLGQADLRSSRCVGNACALAWRGSGKESREGATHTPQQHGCASQPPRELNNKCLPCTDVLMWRTGCCCKRMASSAGVARVGAENETGQRATSDCAAARSDSKKKDSHLT